MLAHTIEPTNAVILFHRTRRAWARSAGQDPGAECAGICSFDKNRCDVGVFDGKASTLVHELTHALLYLLRLNGLDPQDSNGEFMAYAMEKAFDKLSTKL